LIGVVLAESREGMPGGVYQTLHYVSSDATCSPLFFIAVMEVGRKLDLAFSV